MMDHIYSQAHFTIIAPADNANYGLPGVGLRKRRQAKHFEFGRLHFDEFVNLADEFTSSKWTDRAWTFQEGYVSKRRLIFNDHGLIFLCNKMHCWETLGHGTTGGIGEPFVHVVDHHKYLSLFPGIRQPISKSHQSEAMANYCRRTLTFEQDALEACLGVLSAMNVTHYCGIDIRWRGHEFTGDFGMQLYWQNTEPASRRSGFPTWSWTSSTGNKIFDFRDKGSRTCCTEVNVDGSWVDTANWARYWEGDLTEHDSSKLLRITGPTLSPVWISDGTGDIQMSVPFGADLDLVTVHFDCAEDCSNTLDDVLALVIEVPGGSCHDKLIFLLLESSGEYYRRVGVAVGRKTCFEKKRALDFPSQWRAQTELRTLLLE